MPPHTKTTAYMQKGNARVICLNCKAAIEHRQLVRGKAFCSGCESMLFFNESTNFSRARLARKEFRELQC